MPRRFRQVDVFTTDAYFGNPVAVVADAEGLDDAQMQTFARWTNLSETTFVLPPAAAGADYRVRIFTPETELPFAGHPTLGTCHVWLEEGREPKQPGVIVQECGAGLVRVRQTAGVLAFAAPPLLRSGPVDEALVAQASADLGIERAEVVAAQWADNGPGWMAILLDSVDAVLALSPTTVSCDIGVAGPYPPGSPYAYEVRAFSPQIPWVEDPVTGSFNASLAQWLIGSGRTSAPYVASQGTALGRRGRVHVFADDDGTIWVGGGTVTCVSGHVAL